MNNMRKIRMARLVLVKLLPVLAIFCCTAPAFAADPTYSGDFLTRSTLTGDWGGARNDLAKKGVIFDINVTQTEQGVVGGGRSSSWEYGGRGDLTLHLDTGKMGLWPGGFLTAELEGNWGQAVNRSVGALMPVNTNQIFPNPGRSSVAVPALNFAQFLSEYFGVIVGKLDIMSGDMNEFAHGKYGKGDTQFMNTALNANPVLLMTVPYTPLGAGMIILPTKDPKAAIMSLLVVSSVGTAGTTGFSDLNANKLTLNGEARVRTDFFGLTGHQLVGVVYSNKEFTSLDQRFVDVVTQQLNKVKSSWAVYYNFDQFIVETAKGSGKGFGFFGRFGVSDGNPNPMNHFVSAGVGGKGMVASRPNDQFGLGWYFMHIGNPTLTTLNHLHDFLRDENGIEFYYNYAITPWAMLTSDIQVVRPALKRSLTGAGTIDTATVLGLRLQIAL
jgi:porin